MSPPPGDASRPSSAGSPATRPGTDERDWPAQAADTIVYYVDQVRDRTTSKAVVAARGLVFGLLIAVLAGIAAVTLLIFIVRATQVGLVNLADVFGREMPHGRAVWISYWVVGLAFTVGGIVLWRMANRRAVTADLTTEEPAP